MRIRLEKLVEAWAKRPDVFELEPEHVRARYADQVEAKRQEMGLEVSNAIPEREAEELPAEEQAEGGEEVGEEVREYDTPEEEVEEEEVEPEGD